MSLLWTIFLSGTQADGAASVWNIAGHTGKGKREDGGVTSP